MRKLVLLTILLLALSVLLNAYAGNRLDQRKSVVPETGNTQFPSSPVEEE